MTAVFFIGDMGPIFHNLGETRVYHNIRWRLILSFRFDHTFELTHGAHKITLHVNDTDIEYLIDIITPEFV